MTNQEKNKLLVDEQEVRKFSREFLAPYGKTRLFHCMARNKYAGGELSHTSLTLQNSILGFDNLERGEEDLIREIRKAEVLVEAGIYKDRRAKGNIPIEWMVAYMSAFPLDEDDASDAFIAHVMEKRQQHRRAIVNGTIDDATTPAVSRIMSQMKTSLHNSPCRKSRMQKLDIDTKNPELLAQLQSAMVGAKIIIVVETRGGFHIVVERGGPAMQTLWKFASAANANVKKEDQWITLEKGSPMIAIPGTNQGGFTVRIATEEWVEALQSKAPA